MLIRPITAEDGQRLSQYYLANRQHFKPWEPTRSTEFHSLNAWQRRVREYTANQDRKSAMYFVALDTSTAEVIAHCNLSQIFYGPFCACYIGFGAAAKVEGKGVMYRTCVEVIHTAFNELKLHRIMANYMPHNNRSANLIKRLGFVKEGMAKNYLKINGRWENHILTSLTDDKA